MTNWIHAIAALCWVLQLAAAHAQLSAAAPELIWRAPQGCPGRAEVLAMLPQIEQLAGLAITAEVDQVSTGYRLRLQVRGAQRELRAQRCVVLAESAVWLIQLAATQLSAAEPETPASAPVTAPATNESASETARSTVASAAEAGTEAAYLSAGAPEITHEDPAHDAAESGDGGARFRLGLGAAASDIGLSGLSPHLALDLALALADWTLALRLGVLLHPELNVAESATVDLRTDSAQVLGCRLWAAGAVRIGPCLTLSALRSSARTRGLTGSDDDAASWLAAGPALTMQLRLARALFAHAEIGAWAALSARPSFEVSETTLARAGTMAGYARLGASYELW